MRVAGDELRAELRRKAVHVGCGFLALLLRWLTWPQALLLAIVALVHNAFILPRIGGSALLREGERARGWSAGILLYPACLALVILCARERLAIPAGAWALLAFGDGAAGLAGRFFGRRALPWNRAKTLEGLIAHVLIGGLSCAGLLAWVGDDALQGSLLLALVVGASAAVFTAVLETLDAGVDDNILVTLGGAGFLWLALEATRALMQADMHALLLRTVIGVLLCGALAAAAWWRDSLTLAGGAASVLVGTLVLAFAGWGGFAVLFAFFLLGTAATKTGRAVKEARGIAEARGGRRSVGNVLANGGMAALCAPLAIPELAGIVAPLGGLALAASLATAAFDTVSSEIGKAYGRRTWLATTFRPVPPGTEGAVSLEGTLAGFAAALVLGGVAWVAGLFPEGQGSLGLAALGFGAIAGTTFESFAGAALESAGHRVDNHALNFANTLVGALCAVGAFAVFEVLT